MKNLINPFAALIFFVFVTSCNKCKEDVFVTCYDETNQDCENYNPCWESANAYWRVMPFRYLEWDSGDFWDSTFFLDQEYDMVDTLYNGYITFSSMYEAESYKWKIGYDPTIRTTRNVTEMAFGCCTGPITVTLMNEKEKQITCPYDDGRDTFSRELVLIKNPNEFESNFSNMMGIYMGQDEEQPESLRTVEVKYFPLVLGEYLGYRLFNLIDLPYEDTTSQEINISDYNRLACCHFGTPSSTKAYQVKVKGKMITQDSILLEYEYKNKDQENLPLNEQTVTKGTFRGIRVQ
jgi:hypothetical protein